MYSGYKGTRYLRQKLVAGLNIFGATIKSKHKAGAKSHWSLTVAVKDRHERHEYV